MTTTSLPSFHKCKSPTPPRNKPNRYLMAMKYKRMYLAIVQAFEEGKVVAVGTHSQLMFHESVDDFALLWDGVYARWGRNWNYISLPTVSITAYSREEMREIIKDSRKRR
jgi:hypothetical protein